MLEDQGTKARILEAAEKLFSTRGLGKTSLRAITLEAGVNVAAIHYHFGSKHALLHALVARRVEPINRARIDRLDALEQAANGQAPSVDAVLEAFVVPLLQSVEEEDEAQGRLIQLIGRLYAEQEELLESLVRDEFGEVAVRFVAALERALPMHPPVEVAWRLHFAVGVLVHVLLGRHDLGILPYLAGEPRADHRMADRLIAFLAAGFRAPTGGLA